MSFIESLKSKEFLVKYFRDFSWVAAGIGLALIVDFFFYILAGRLMTPTQFGYFGVLISLYYIILRSPFRALEVVSKKMEAEKRDSLASMGSAALFVGLTAALLFLIFAGQISDLLGVPNSSVLVFSLVFPLGYYLAILVGKVQGEKKYRLYGLYEFTSSLVAFLAIFLVYAGFGATGAVAVFVMEITAGFVLLSYFEGLKIGREGFSDNKLFYDSFIFILAVHAAFSLDLLMVKNFFSAEVAGYYNTVAVLGKGLFFGSVAVNRSVFPKFVTDEDERIKNLQLSQLLVIIGGLSAAIFFYLLGDIFIARTFGSSYVKAASYAPHYMIMISAISSTGLMANYSLSVDVGNVKSMLLMPLMQLILIGFFHETIIQVIYATFVSAISTVLVMMWFIWHDGENVGLF